MSIPRESPCNQRIPAVYYGLEQVDTGGCDRFKAAESHRRLLLFHAARFLAASFAYRAKEALRARS